jgi:hypothetical protein
MIFSKAQPGVTFAQARDAYRENGSDMPTVDCALDPAEHRPDHLFPDAPQQDVTDLYLISGHYRVPHA